MRKQVSLGGGVTRTVSYRELKGLLRDTLVLKRQKILKKYFPEEVAAEYQQELVKLNDIRWSRYQAGSVANDTKPYRITHQELLQRASRAAGGPKCDPSNGHHHRVSDFAGWLFDLYDTSRSPYARDHGKQGELKVHLRKKEIPRLAHGPAWRPLYIDPLDGKPEALEISLLTVHGRPLYGAPDYAFKNDATGIIVIVEVKVSDRELWSSGWPNLRAQLWAYGHIDQFVNDARKTVLVGEVWANTGEQVSLRQTLTWHLSDSTLCAQNQQLFEAYQRWAER